MHADLIFNEKSQTINIRKESEHAQKHSVSNIACNLWKIKFP